MSSELDAVPARDALLFSPGDERQHLPGRSETEERSPRARRMARFESGLEFPVGVEARRFSNVLPVKAAKECLEVRYRRSRWSKVDYEGSDDVRARITDGIIMVEGERAGRIQFTEFRLGTFVTRREFWRTMDDASAEMSALAGVINECWEEPTDVAAYGDIVELKRVWIRPSLTGRGRLDAVSDTMLTELFESRALLILKAFPLEYEGAVTPDNEAMFKRRQAAMMRRYSAMLGVQPLPGKNGQEGWMYGVPARLAGIIQRPATWGPPIADEDW